jgi:tRNA(fMet)-specific endonuclease VapC
VAVKVLLDTNAYSELKRGNPTVADIVRAAEEIQISAVVAGELLYGFRRGHRYERNVRELNTFLARPHVRLVPVTWVTADRYARIAQQLRDQGTPIPANDIWIAAQALETGADLISLDGHFEHVRGLAWVRPS